MTLERSRQDAAMRLLVDRIDYERMRSMPYGGADLRLARMHQLLGRLGNPHQDLAIVHVAGTKGKGSTAAMTAAVLTAAGYTTGLFTSPHLEHIEERIAVDGTPISSQEFAKLVELMRPAIVAMDQAAKRANDPNLAPTFFELITALGFLCFARRRVAAAVVEVGLGGRLDSTNVCQPLVSVITSISLDHTQQLGNTTVAIAYEKAGIMKPGVPVVSGVVDPEPRAVIREVAAERGSRLVELDRDFKASYAPPRHLEIAAAAGSCDFVCRLPDREIAWSAVPLRLPGRHQAANAAVAMATIAELQSVGWAIPETAIRVALGTLHWPARVEVIARQPTIVLDAAHNVASIDALLETLAESFDAQRRFLIFGTTQDKDARGMLERLLPRFDQVSLTCYTSNPRSVPPEELAQIALHLAGRQFPVFSDPAAAWAAVGPQLKPGDLLCVTGSFYLAAEMREAIERRPTSCSLRASC